MSECSVQKRKKTLMKCEFKIRIFIKPEEIFLILLSTILLLRLLLLLFRFFPSLYLCLVEALRGDIHSNWMIHVSLQDTRSRRSRGRDWSVVRISVRIVMSGVGDGMGVRYWRRVISSISLLIISSSITSVSFSLIPHSST